MKTIGIPKEARMRLSSISEEGESVDDTLSRILDEVDGNNCALTGRTTIQISDETYGKLLGKKGKGETLVKVIERAIRSHKLNGNND